MKDIDWVKDKKDNNVSEHIGFTLIEVMIAILLSTVLTLLTFTVFQYSNKTNIYNLEISSIQQNLLFAMEMIETDVRNAGCNPLKGTFHAFMDVSSTTTLGINADLRDCKNISNPNPGEANYSVCLANVSFSGTDTDVAERVKYSLGVNGVLNRLESRQNGNDYILQSIANNIKQFTFTYTTGAIGQTIEDRVSEVIVTIVAEGSRNDPDTGKKLERTMQRRIIVRNYGT
jgi:type IV pilus assembly protein PilW